MFELVFRTTNKSKLAHLRYAAKDYDVIIKTVGDYGKPYTEPRLEDREELLTASLKDALLRDLKKRKEEKPSDDMLSEMSVDGEFNRYNGNAFIIEDTSLIVEAFSNKEKEVPGVDVKYWMKDLTFDELDKKLKLKGNNRSVTVRSDVILVIPNKGISKRFIAESEGSVTNKEYNIKTNPVYPWLDNKTFNKWFIPNGENKPISLMEVKHSEPYDFRTKAFKKLFKYLESEGLVDRKKEETHQDRFIQLQLLSQPIFLISGPTCAGKTVLAKHINKTLSYYHIEASDFMHLAYYNYHGTSSDIKIHDFAKEILKEHPEIVAEQIIIFLNQMQSIPVVVTGFRDPKEVMYFSKYHTKEDPIKVIYVECDIDIRFQRNIKRGRYDSSKSRSKFKETDEKQYQMGLANIKELSNCITLRNENSIFEYYKTFDTLFVPNNLKTVNTFIWHYKELLTTIPRLEHLILLTLYESYSSEYFTTNQITEMVNSNFNSLFADVRNPISPTNVGRYFNSKFHPFYEIKLTERNSNSYRLSQTGISEALLVLHNAIG